MEILDRLSRFIKAQIDYGSNNPEEVINKCIKEMELTIVQLRKAIAKTIADKKRSEEKYNYHLSEANRWQTKAELALAAEKENLARESLIHKQFFQGNVSELEASIESNKRSDTITYLQKKLTFLEMKLADYKLLQAKYNFSNCLKAYKELQETIEKIHISTTLNIFKLIEVETQCAAELDSIILEQKLSRLVPSSDTENELAAIKALLSSSSENLDSSPTNTSQVSYFDAELEELKTQPNNI